MKDLENAPLEAGTVREFSEQYEQVLKAAQGAVAQAGLKVKETRTVDETTTVILSESGFSAWSWGELVRVVVQRSSGELTIVRVHTMRRIPMNITAKGDYSDTILANISLALREI